MFTKKRRTFGTWLSLFSLGLATFASLPGSAQVNTTPASIGTAPPQPLNVQVIPSGASPTPTGPTYLPPGAKPPARPVAPGTQVVGSASVTPNSNLGYAQPPSGAYRTISGQPQRSPPYPPPVGLVGQPRIPSYAPGTYTTQASQGVRPNDQPTAVGQTAGTQPAPQTLATGRPPLVGQNSLAAQPGGQAAVGQPASVPYLGQPTPVAQGVTTGPITGPPIGQPPILVVQPAQPMIAQPAPVAQALPQPPVIVVQPPPTSPPPTPPPANLNVPNQNLLIQPQPQIIGYKYRPRWGIFVGGMVIFTTSYLASVVSGAVVSDKCSGDPTSLGTWCQGDNSKLYIPVVGPFLRMRDFPASGDESSKVGLGFTGALQAGGLLMSVLGLTIVKKIPIYSTSIQAQLVPTGNGLMVNGSF